MSAHRHWCPECCGWGNACRDGCPASMGGIGSVGADRLCDEHARLACRRAFEIVSAIVIAACVRDLVGKGLSLGAAYHSPAATRKAEARYDEARAALLGYASVEAMREAERP